MKLSGFLIVVKDIKKAEKYYHDLFGMDTLRDNDGNMILSDGLFLQEEKYWRGFIGKREILFSLFTPFNKVLRELEGAFSRAPSKTYSSSPLEKYIREKSTLAGAFSFSA